MIVKQKEAVLGVLPISKRVALPSHFGHQFFKDDSCLYKCCLKDVNAK